METDSKFLFLVFVVLYLYLFVTLLNLVKKILTYMITILPLDSVHKFLVGILMLILIVLLDLKIYIPTVHLIQLVLVFPVAGLFHKLILLLDGPLLLSLSLSYTLVKNL